MTRAIQIRYLIAGVVVLVMFLLDGSANVKFLALFTLAMVAGVIYAIITYGEIPDHIVKAVVSSVLYAFFTLLLYINLYISTPLHNGREGSYASEWHYAVVLSGMGAFPLYQIAISTICMLPIPFFLYKHHQRKVRYFAIIALLLIGMALQFEFSIIIRDRYREPFYTPSPASAQAVTRGRMYHIMRWFPDIQLANAEFLPGGYQPDRIYPPGWIEPGETWGRNWFYTDPKDGGLIIQQFRSHDCIVKANYRWFTPITGLYKVEFPITGIWYPGGKLAAGLPKVEFRERYPASR